MITIHGKYLAGEILANHTGKSYWQGKIWQISYSQCICQIATFFGVPVNISEEIFGEWLTIHQICLSKFFHVWYIIHMYVAYQYVWTASLDPCSRDAHTQFNLASHIFISFVL